MISHLDYEIGRLLQSLREKNLLEDTVLVFTGDNGLAVGCHGMLGKQNLYDHSVRVPLVFAGAGVPKNKKVENYVYLMDIYPTLCELTGHEVPDIRGREELCGYVRGRQRQNQGDPVSGLPGPDAGRQGQPL